MKLLCINTDVIEAVTNGKLYKYHGQDLVLGKIYTTRGKPLPHRKTKRPCYFIDELNTTKLAERFTELLDEPAIKLNQYLE